MLPALRHRCDLRAISMEPLAVTLPFKATDPVQEPVYLVGGALGKTPRPWENANRDGGATPKLQHMAHAPVPDGGPNAPPHGLVPPEELRGAAFNGTGYPQEPVVESGEKVALAPAAVISRALAVRAAAAIGRRLLRRAPAAGRKGKFADKDTIVIPPLAPLEPDENRPEPDPKKPLLAVPPPNRDERTDDAPEPEETDAPKVEYAPPARSLQHAIRREFFLEQFSRDVVEEDFGQPPRPQRNNTAAAAGELYPTQHGNNLAAQECRKILKRGHPELADRVKHIRGGHRDGVVNGNQNYLKEAHIAHSDDPKKFRRPDLTYFIDDATYAAAIGSATAHINTQSTRKSGRPTGRDTLSLNDLRKLQLLQDDVVRVIAHGMSKMKKGQPDGEYRKIAKGACEDFFKDWLGKPRRRRALLRSQRNDMDQRQTSKKAEPRSGRPDAERPATVNGKDRHPD